MTSRLDRIGFSEHFAVELAAVETKQADVCAARVAKAMRKECDVWTADGELRVRIPKRVFRMEAGAPVVGDWVAVSPEQARVIKVLARQSTLARKAAGRATTTQVVVANVHTAFVMVGLDGDYNLRRIERYLAVAWQGQVEPVVLLNKTDLHDDPDRMLDEVRGVASGAAVHLISAKHGNGLDALEGYLLPARTVVILGSSGAGKSTLVNHLLGEERMPTADVRARDDRGRHTTTHRELIPLESGALLIDTPGMRELGLVDHQDGIAEAFSDVEELAAACRFADCRHESEPGCAIVAALDDGSLRGERLASWRKLSTEVDVATARQKKEKELAKHRLVARERQKRKYR